MGSREASWALPTIRWPDSWTGLLSRARAAVARINDLAPLLESHSDARLRRDFLSLRYRAGCGEPLLQLLPETYALVREAGRRAKGMRHYDVQLLGGVVIFNGAVAEMRTGEGKTLTATLPMTLAALANRGAHLATANDYLAARDAELMRPIYHLLGLEVGVVEAATPRPQRRLAYAADLTYSTAKELGFDFLRDRLLENELDQTAAGISLAAMLGQQTRQGGSGVVQRDRFFALVDEADSILIDEARTPLIVSSIAHHDHSQQAALHKWAYETAAALERDVDYTYHAKTYQATLTETGRRGVRQAVAPSELAAVEMFELYRRVECALRVAHQFVLDRDYVVRDDEIVIIDENTGRPAEGRKWRDGVHQAVEAREGVPISPETGEAARVTIQSFFLDYEQLAGMTGTAANSRHELRHIYQLQVASIPTHRPEQRIRLPDRVFLAMDDKWRAVAARVESLRESGRPVLIGCKSIERSESLARVLSDAGIEHYVLNARFLEREAQLVAQAGQAGRVTVATNMAGRGTDIELGEGVDELGGLHVIGSELHDSARIDRQLVGRCGRQGDPGSYEQFHSLDDQVLKVGLGEMKAERVRARASALAARGESLDSLARLFRVAQRKIEQRHYQSRKLLLQAEKRRQDLQRQMGQDPFLEAAE